MAARYLQIPIGEELHGQEVNTILRRTLHLSGTVLRRIKWLDDGITVDGKRVTVRHRVQVGEVLSVRLTDPVSTSGTVPTPGPLDIVWEDEDVVVVNKAPGVLVHPGHGHFSDTLGNFLMYHYQQTGQECDFHPVHRLDKGTSGLLVVAKHPHAQEQLKQQLHTPQFRRVYLAICDGLPPAPSGTIDAPIGLAPDSRARTVCPQGQSARTHYRVVSAWEGHSLVELTLDTGRTHQIRVHMAHIGCPLTGDFLYGQEQPDKIARPALHSHQLSFTHPITGEPLAFTQPLPGDMAALLPHTI
ncbi:RluA family pseudouridine synthase [Pseudoflavonifractor capillosus]|uniref:RluA family pseudouridine synthase n=1 Tax=Pseudoflavonifractor capillosus TaxID=106588 RepID=UPI00195E996A|nr:RluA family pseudouridine synthase [Pseudoflavonifractor capillosus]MBM6896561.1 RluA family pseudouridine synthase [Pseudoflavonifractor capillosus]